MQFDELKTTQAAAVLLTRARGRMSYMALIKLLYMADREALAKWGMPITGARYFSLKHGPVLSEVLSLIQDPRPGDAWGTHIRKDGYEAELVMSPGEDHLCDADVALLNRMFDDYGHFNRWRIRDITHEMPEWTDPGNGRKPIEIEEILAAFGFDRNETEQTVRDLGYHAWIRARLEAL